MSTKNCNTIWSGYSELSKYLYELYKKDPRQYISSETLKDYFFENNIYRNYIYYKNIIDFLNDGSDHYLKDWIKLLVSYIQKVVNVTDILNILASVSVTGDYFILKKDIRNSYSQYLKIKLPEEIDFSVYELLSIVIDEDEYNNSTVRERYKLLIKATLNKHKYSYSFSKEELLNIIKDTKELYLRSGYYLRGLCTYFSIAISANPIYYIGRGCIKPDFIPVQMYIPEFNCNTFKIPEKSYKQLWWNSNDKTSRISALNKLISIYEEYIRLSK